MLGCLSVRLCKCVRCQQGKVFFSSPSNWICTCRRKPGFMWNKRLFSYDPEYSILLFHSLYPLVSAQERGCGCVCVCMCLCVCVFTTHLCLHEIRWKIFFLPLLRHQTLIIPIMIRDFCKFFCKILKRVTQDMWCHVTNTNPDVCGFMMKIEVALMHPCRLLPGVLTCYQQLQHNVVGYVKPKTLWKAVTLQQQSRAKQVLKFFLTSGGVEPMAWITHTTPEPARMCLHVFPSVLRYQNSIGLLMLPRRADLGCYINQISAILERPDAHISTITPEMTLELESEGCWELWEDVWAPSLNSGKVGGEQLLTDRHTLVV